MTRAVLVVVTFVAVGLGVNAWADVEPGRTIMPVAPTAQLAGTSPGSAAAIDAGVPDASPEAHAQADARAQAEARARAATLAVFEHNNCGDRLVLCVTPTGQLVSGERLGEYRVGERVHVIALGPSGGTYSIDVSVIKSANTVTPAAHRDELLADAEPDQPIKLTERVIDVPNADELTIYIVEAGDPPKLGSLTLSIEEPLYFARAGLAFTWVDRGARTITAEHTIIEEAAFFPGVALTLWPWGHRANSLSGFERLSRGRTIGDLVAFQIGTDLDFSTPFDRAFFGVVIEPIAGVGLGTGVAVTTGSYFSGAPAGSTMSVVDRHMWRPYFSLTLTTELFDTLKSLAGKKEAPSS